MHEFRVHEHGAAGGGKSGKNSFGLFLSRHIHGKQSLQRRSFFRRQLPEVMIDN